MEPSIWNDFLTIMGQEVGTRAIDTWFKALALERWDPINHVAYLEAPNAFVKDWIKNNYLPAIAFHLGRLLRTNSLDVVVLDARAHKKDSFVPTMSTTVTTIAQVATDTQRPAAVSSAAVPVRVQPARVLGHVNKGYMLETFVVGPHNRLAYAAACAVTEKPGLAYNPLFICSSPGLGKTHLLHAIGNRIRTQKKNNAVLYQGADRFVHEFVHALRSDKVHLFHAKYRHIDVLLMDDVQLIANKKQTQEAFFHIFNDLYNERKQIVFSGSVLPTHMEGLDERLRSRLSGGLVAGIEAPCLETRIAIVKRKAEMNNVSIDDDVASFIAASAHTSIRELEGALVRVLAFCSISKNGLCLELAQKVLACPAPNDICKRALNFDLVVNAVRGHFPSYSTEDIKSKRRNKELVFVRHLTMFIMKRLTGKSLRDIGRFLGGRDHATVAHALEKMEEHFACSGEFRGTVRALEVELAG